jgi:Flp pilus assembly protein TadG
MTRPRPASRAAGVTSVEFAFIALIFFSLLLGIADFGRWVMTINAASESTRYGVRIAVVCKPDSLSRPAILSGMRRFLPELTNDALKIEYSPANCTAQDCELVSVWIENVAIDSIAWFLPDRLPIPSFQTTLPRESLDEKGDNPMCS